LHWQVGGLLALEDAIDVARHALALVEEIRPIRNQAAATAKTWASSFRARSFAQSEGLSTGGNGWGRQLPSDDWPDQAGFPPNASGLM
jgi:hypothetical protein